MHNLLFSDLIAIGGIAPQADKPWIMHLPVISTAHIPPAELGIMDDMRSEGWFPLASPMGRQVNGSWAVVTSTDPEGREGALWALVPVLQHILNALHDAGFQHARFDAECGDFFSDLRDYSADDSDGASVGMEATDTSGAAFAAC